MRSSEINQIFLIISGLMVTLLFGIFLYREIFPEYKIYQKDYLALEKFHSESTHEPPPAFALGIKQIVIEREDRGPPVIDRCTSCHVALQIPYFSPTKIAQDINGNLMRDREGHPLLVRNEDYIWAKLDQKINDLRDEKVNQQLREEGNSNQVKERLKQADTYEALKTTQVGDYVYDVTKVLAMHPLMGKETRPFEYHPVEEYGCTSCHNGNGRGLTTDKAHGPVFDEKYEVESTGPTPHFTESDAANDPSFAHVFNHKPGSELLFQTQPLFVGPLIQAKCMQCHQTSEMQLQQAASSASEITQKQKNQLKNLKNSFETDKRTIISLLELHQSLFQKGYAQTLHDLEKEQEDYTKPPEELESMASQLIYLKKVGSSYDEEEAKKRALEQLNQQIVALLGSWELAQELEKSYDQKQGISIDQFLISHQQDKGANGTLFLKLEALKYQEALQRHIQETESSFQSAVEDQKVIAALNTDVDELTRNYQRGKGLYLSQACYACHRIGGFARGGVGPELTKIGDHYPWYIKESIVWPQADLKTSTMPNMRLDHQELENLMVFLLAQKGGSKAVAQRSYQAALQSWEAGRKMPWEKPIPPAQMYDLRYAMTIFAVEGCASCHRLEGFESNVGFKVETQKHTFDELYEEQEWFKKLFPEVIQIAQYDQPLPGSHIVEQIEKHAKEIDERIVSQVRQNSILEEINQKYPDTIESLYSEFRYAARAKNNDYDTLIKQEKDSRRQEELKQEWNNWKDRVHRVLMMYIQQYGLGRLIGPHPNWSGIYRSDEWLMEHFRNPSSHVPRSIMPVMPFDDTKFYALTYMLDQLAIRNRQKTRAIWENRGFNPAQAFEMYCSQCHGLNYTGNGPIAEWIYPLPKSLRNSDFIRHLTKERAIYSIKHGVRGTPMPPWGEVAKDKPQHIQQQFGNIPVLTDDEINHLVNWLFTSLPGGEVLKVPADVLKWQYQPEDVLEELEREGGILTPLPSTESIGDQQDRLLQEKNLPEENNPPVEPQLSTLFPTYEHYYAAIRPEVYPIKQENRVEDVFNVVSAPNEPDKKMYYIQKKYYTPHNLQEGQNFFLLNCAPCHGNEGDGSGIRSQAMQEAKPRMLTNLDWISSRDDLRLLRSIKYGVPGTSMTPWGDFTNSLQRMQLVMFIRTLSREQGRRITLDSKLYQSFDEAQLTIENARIQLNEKVMAYQKQKQLLGEQLSEVEHQVVEKNIDPRLALEAYQRHLELEEKIRQIQEQDQQLVSLKAEVKKERELYQMLGISLISKDVPDPLLNTFFQLIEANEHRYQLENQELFLADTHSQVEEKIEGLKNRLIQEIDRKIRELEESKIGLEGEKKLQDIRTVEADIQSYKKIRVKVLTDIEEALRLLAKQKSIIQTFHADENKAKKTKTHANSV